MDQVWGHLLFYLWVGENNYLTPNIHTETCSPKENVSTVTSRTSTKWPNKGLQPRHQTEDWQNRYLIWTYWKGLWLKQIIRGKHPIRVIQLSPRLSLGKYCDYGNDGLWWDLKSRLLHVSWNHNMLIQLPWPPNTYFMPCCRNITVLPLLVLALDVILQYRLK